MLRIWRSIVRRKKTAFDRYFDARMKDRAFAAAYAEARGVIDSTDALIRMLDEARLLVGVSKADLARQIEARPEIVRRLFTSRRANPTLATVLKLVEALGFRLELVPNERVRSGREARP
jgi:DNA-binding phage protein